MDPRLAGFAAAYVRISTEDGVPVGAGFLVSDDGHVLTCAHVVAAALRDDTIEAQTESLQVTIRLNFHFLEGQPLRTASVVHWRPRMGPDTNPSGDIAVLQLIEGLPDKAQPIGLTATDEMFGHEFRAHGFPRDTNSGVWAYGVMRDLLGNGWLQVEDTKEQGRRIEQGFSGGPVQDSTTGQFVGMVAASSEYVKVAKVGFVIPTNALARAWPDLNVNEGNRKPLADTASPLSNTLWNVPYARNPFFTGRSLVLDDIRGALENTSTVAVAQAISGLGGIGKTQTAVEYAYRHRDQYETILWSVGENEATMLAGYAEIARLLNLPEATSLDQNRIVEAVKRWFETNERWLLILDSADSPSLVRPFLPLSARGHILVTSRAQNFDMLGVSRAFHLQEMSPDEVLEFFLKRTGRQDADTQERQAAAKLAEEFGGLPLALEQAGAYIAAHQVRFDDYLASFKKRQLELLEASPPVAGGYPSSVATTWSLNFEQIEQVSTAAADLLRLSAFLGPDSSIPLELVTGGVSEMGLALSAALAQVQEDPVAINTVLEPLTRYSLVRRDIKSNTYNIHRLVQEVIKAAMGEESRRFWTEKVERVLLRVVGFRWRKNMPLQLLPLLPHLEAAAAAAKYREDEQAGDLCNALSLSLFQLERFEEALPHSQHAWEFAEKSLGPEDPKTLARRENHGVILKNTGDFDAALSIFGELLGTSKRVLGYQHPNIASIHNNMGSALREKGVSLEDERFFAKTLSHYKRALTIRQKKLKEHASTAESLHNMGALLMDMNRCDEARPCLEQALKMNEKVKGPMYGRNAGILKRLGTVQKSQEDFQGTRASYEQELKVRKKAFGLEHPETARTLHDLVDILIQHGPPEAAPQYLQQELTTSDVTLGEHHPYTNLVRQCLNGLSAS